MIAGAGFGTLSAHLAYLTHRNRWGRPPIGRDVGLVLSWSPAGGTGLSSPSGPASGRTLQKILSIKRVFCGGLRQFYLSPKTQPPDHEADAQ